MKKYLLTTLLVLGFAVVAHAAPVGLTSEADLVDGELWADNDVGVSVGFVADSVSKRNIEIAKGEFEIDSYAARIAVSLFDKLTIYGDIGNTTGMTFDWEDLGEMISAEFEDSGIYGIGANILIYRWDNGLEVGAGASYRTAEMNLDSAVVNGLNVAKSDLSTYQEGDFEETQVALEAAYRTDIFSPYVGVKFSDVEVDADFTYAAQQRKAMGKEASENVGVFVGLTVTPSIEAMGDKGNQLSFNLEGRFLDEEAVSGGVSFRF